MAAGNGIPKFTVSIPADARQQLRDGGRRAVELGLRAEYAADLRRMNDRLERAPKEFGDRIRDFANAKLAVFRGLTEYLIVHYAVHTERPIVFVQSVRFRPDRPLGQA